MCLCFVYVCYLSFTLLLYLCEGDVLRLRHVQSIMQVVAKVPDSEVASDLDATVAWAKSTGKADTTKLGITGFCWGGRQVWLYAAHNPDVKAGVAWYGPLQIPTSDLRPKNPIDLASQINARVLGLYGGADQGIPVAQIEQIRAALKAAGKKSEIIIYPDTPHGFNADYRPSYRPEAAKDGWKRMQAWFNQNGVA
jgi:carboxymethylenebutenolidase